MAGLSDFVFTLPADDDDTTTYGARGTHNGSDVIRREDDEDASDRASWRSRNNRSSKSAAPATAAAATKVSPSPSNASSRGIKRGRNDDITSSSMVGNDSNDDSDNDDDNDGDETEKLSGAFEFEDVMTPTPGTWAAQLFNRTGEDNHLLHAPSSGRAASRATSLSTKIERRLEKKSRAVSDAKEAANEAAAFASFAATPSSTSKKATKSSKSNNNSNSSIGSGSEVSLEVASDASDDDNVIDDSDDDNDSIGDHDGSDDSDLDTVIDIPLPADNDNNDNEGDNDSKDDSKSSSNGITDSSNGDNDNNDDGLPADQISTKSHNRSGAAPMRVTALDSKTVAIAARQRTVTDFAELKLSRALLRAIKDLNFVTPTPVQQQAIPLAMAGADILVNAMTGSGKTAAFMLPILERLLYRPRRVPVTRVLVLTPTRELAAQCDAMTKALAKYTDIRVALIVGGLSLVAQEQSLRTRPDIIVATPGRMIDHLRNAHSVHCEDLEILVLDEADRLLELGFADEVREIVKSCPRGRQTMLYSATLTDEVVDLVNLSLNEPKRVTIDSAMMVVDKLTQEFVRIRSAKNDRDREAIVLSLCKRSFASHTIIFCRTKVSAHRLALILGLNKLRAAELHGNLSQQQRLEALELFRDAKVDYLICTDLAARGLDIKGVETVINMSLPKQLRQYVHRVGRTARAGRMGHAVTLVDDAQRKTLKEIIKGAKMGVKNRVIATEVLDKYRQLITDLEPDIAAIITTEKTEKNLRVAEEQTNRASNLMQFQDEIHSRPARTWFQSNKDKMATKLMSTQLNSRPGDVDEATLLAEAKAKKIADKRASRDDKKKDKDPLKGLSRKKKRRKLLVMEAEKMAAERKLEMAAMGVGDDSLMATKAAKQQVNLHGSIRSVKSSKHPTKAQLDGDDIVHKRSKKKKAAAVAGRYAAATKESRDRRFDAPAEHAADPKKPYKTKSKRAFKSAAKHKRRDRK